MISPNNPLYFTVITVFAGTLLLIMSFHPAFSFETIPESDESKAAFVRSYPRLEKLLSQKNLRMGAPVFLRIFKQESELELWLLSDTGQYELFKRYGICDYSGRLGPKQTEGDKQSPEGFYQVYSSQLNPWSKYHLSFNLGYPNNFDRYHQRTGGALMIHGRCSSIGCFAMTDYYMDEIYSLVSSAIAHGQQFFQVHIFPFRFTNEWWENYRESRWSYFWKNLKEGYDIFEQERIPPRVSSSNGRYVFNIRTKATPVARHPGWQRKSVEMTIQ